MASPVDIQCCYDSILTLREMKRLRLITPDYFKEHKMILLNIARKYEQVCLTGNIRANDIE